MTVDETAEPEGVSEIRARRPAVVPDTETAIVSPAASVPDVRLRRSHGASVDADQPTGPRPDAVSVIVVTAPEVRAVTASRASPCRAPPVLTTSAVTSGTRAPKRSPGGRGRCSRRSSPLTARAVHLRGGDRPSWPSPVAAPRYAAQRAMTGGGTTVATTVVVTTRARSRSRRAAWSLGSSGYAGRSAGPRRGSGGLGHRDAAEAGASTRGRAAGVPLRARAGVRPFGGAAAAGAVVDVPDELAAQGGGEQHLVVAGEPGDGGAVAALHGEGRAGPLHLAGRGGRSSRRCGSPTRRRRRAGRAGGELEGSDDHRTLYVTGGVQWQPTTGDDARKVRPRHR
ncbi:hypothetical protein SBADM41S_10450 [Streptomyces badius]